MSGGLATALGRGGFRSLSPPAQLLVIRERLVGTYYGLFSLVSALVAAVVACLVGGLIELTDPTLRWSPAAALLAIGLAGAGGVATMQRRGLLAPR